MCFTHVNRQPPPMSSAGARRKPSRQLLSRQLLQLQLQFQGHVGVLSAIEFAFDDCSALDAIWKRLHCCPQLAKAAKTAEGHPNWLFMAPSVDTNLSQSLESESQSEIGQRHDNHSHNHKWFRRCHRLDPYKSLTLLIVPVRQSTTTAAAQRHHHHQRQITGPASIQEQHVAPSY